MTKHFPTPSSIHAPQPPTIENANLTLSVDYAPIAIVAIDRQEKIITWNRQIEQLLGIKTTDVLDKSLNTLTHPTFKMLAGLYAHAAKGKSIHQFDVILESNTKGLLDIKISSGPILNDANQVIGITFFLIDTTLQQKETLSRKASEDRLSAISVNLPGAVCELIYHHKEQVLLMPYISEGSIRLFGIEPIVFTEKPAYFLNLLMPGEYERLMSTIATAAENQNLLRFEGKVNKPLLTSQHAPPPHSDDDFEDISTEDEFPEYWIHIAATPRNAGEHVTIWEGIIIDVTLQKNTEQRLVDSEKQLRGLNKHIEKAKEKERAAVAREIHDDIGGTLTKLKADLSWLRKNTPKEESITTKLNDIDQLANHLVQSSTRIARDLRPGILDYGIVPAIEWQAKEFEDRTGIKVLINCNDEDVTLDVEQSTAIFRVFQESLTNIMKHAEASSVEVEIFVNKNSLTLEIRDNGKGLDGSDLNKQNSFGIRGMMERIRAIGGWLDISGELNCGTTTMISIPRKKPLG
jgi:PAS domain S-box-containing protein